MFCMRKWVNVAAIKLRSFEDNSILGWEPSSMTKTAPLVGDVCMGDVTCGRNCIWWGLRALIIQSTSQMV